MDNPKLAPELHDELGHWRFGAVLLGIGLAAWALVWLVSNQNGGPFRLAFFAACIAWVGLGLTVYPLTSRESKGVTAAWEDEVYTPSWWDLLPVHKWVLFSRSTMAAILAAPGLLKVWLLLTPIAGGAGYSLVRHLV